jgi:integrase
VTVAIPGNEIRLLRGKLALETAWAGSRYRPNEIGFGVAAREWLRYIELDRKRRPSTIRDYRDVVRSHLIPAFGEATPITAISPSLVETYRERLVAETGLAPRTINKILTNLNGIFRRAGQAYGLQSNPVALVDRQPVRWSGDFRVLAPSEINRLLCAAVNIQDRAIFAIAAYAGLRVGELRALCWGDVDFDAQVIHVRRSYVLGAIQLPKSGRVRSVPLIPQASTCLLALQTMRQNVGDRHLVFRSPGGGVIDDSTLRRRFYVGLATAGLQHMRLHDLRHTFGTLAVRAFPLSDVAAFMGHADIQTTMIYVHYVPRADAAARLASVMGEDAGLV